MDENFGSLKDLMALAELKERLLDAIMTPSDHFMAATLLCCHRNKLLSIDSVIAIQ